MNDLRERAINYVLYCFLDMGAGAEDLSVERQKLAQDDGYLDMWASVTGFCENQLGE
jgi:hypothetical protein